MSTIREFDFGSVERRKLEAAAKVFTAFTGVKAEVRETYFDFGQDWKWTTIIAGDKKQDSVTGSYQLLNPRQQDMIVEGSIEDFNKALAELIAKANERGW